MIFQNGENNSSSWLRAWKPDLVKKEIRPCKFRQIQIMQIRFYRFQLVNAGVFNVFTRNCHVLMYLNRIATFWCIQTELLRFDVYKQNCYVLMYSNGIATSWCIQTELLRFEVFKQNCYVLMYSNRIAMFWKAFIRFMWLVNGR